MQQFVWPNSLRLALFAAWANFSKFSVSNWAFQTDICGNGCDKISCFVPHRRFSCSDITTTREVQVCWQVLSFSKPSINSYLVLYLHSRCQGMLNVTPKICASTQIFSAPAVCCLISLLYFIICVECSKSKLHFARYAVCSISKQFEYNRCHLWSEIVHHSFLANFVVFWLISVER